MSCLFGVQCGDVLVEKKGGGGGEEKFGGMIEAGEIYFLSLQCAFLNC